jgi:hypothetical protein
MISAGNHAQSTIDAPCGEVHPSAVGSQDNRYQGIVDTIVQLSANQCSGQINAMSSD